MELSYHMQWWGWRGKTLWLHKSQFLTKKLRIQLYPWSKSHKNKRCQEYHESWSYGLFELYPIRRNLIDIFIFWTKSSTEWDNDLWILFLFGYHFNLLSNHFTLFENDWLSHWCGPKHFTIDRSLQNQIEVFRY